MDAILALDCATATGWAVAKRNGHDWKLHESGVQTFDLKRGESAGLRFLRFRNWLETMDRTAGPFDLFLYEQAHHRGGPATELCVGMTTRVMEFAAGKEKQYAGIHSQTLKKFATGSGRADKELMVARAIEIWNVKVLDHNHGDALLLLKFGIENYG